MIKIKSVTTSYGKLKNLNLENRVYIAALIDGEGTVALTRKQRNEYRRLETQISNNDLKLLEWAKMSIGAGQIIIKRPRDNRKHATSYTYRICNRQAFNLLAQISSYLKTYKRKRAELVLKNYIKLTPRNGKYTPELLAQREKFIKAFFSIPSPRKIKPKFIPY